MNKFLTITLSTFIAMPVLSGCGFHSSSTENVTSTNTHGTEANKIHATTEPEVSTNKNENAQSSTSSSPSNQDATSSQASTNPLHLVPFTDMKASGVSVNIPEGWTKTKVTGGDYAGWKFTDPSDQNKQVTIVYSGCVGCYMQNGKPKVTSVIPEQNIQKSFLFNQDLSAGFSFQKNGNPYIGNGVVTVSNNESGYAYVEVLLPSQEQTYATDVLNSFQFQP